MVFLGKQLSTKQIFVVLVMVTLIVYQLLRVIVFVNVYGGLEHDGGWLLGVARSLAERGAYTTMVSTIVDPTVRGGVNVDGKFNIQDEQGRIWFFTGNGIGPGSIAVDALFLKLFGVGFWQLHLGPLFFFSLYLILASLILLRVRGLGAAAPFHLYLFLYPTLSIFLGYEAMGEVPAMAYILLAFLLFAYTVRKPAGGRRRWLWFFISGLAVGLAINTKLIALLSLGGVFVVWLKQVWQRRSGLVEGLLLAGGALSVLALWELVHLVILSRLAGFAMYRRHLQERIRFILDDGSGLGAQDHSGTQFLWDKALLFSEISHPNRVLALLALLLVAVGGLALIWLYRRDEARQNWVLLLWAGWLGNAAWFIGLAKTGWVRHAWFGLILAVMVICLIVGELVYRIRNRPGWGLAVAAVLVAGIILPGFVAQRQAATMFITDQLVESWHQEQLAAKYTKVPWMIIPRAEQERVVDFLQRLPPQARVFYPANAKAAEIAVLSGKIFYPLDRQDLMSPEESDVILIGATLISPWKDPGIRHSIIERARVECPNFLYELPHYIICRQ